MAIKGTMADSRGGGVSGRLLISIISFVLWSVICELLSTCYKSVD